MAQCAREYCENDAEPGSDYCYFHGGPNTQCCDNHSNSLGGGPGTCAIEFCFEEAMVGSDYCMFHADAGN